MKTTIEFTIALRNPDGKEAKQSFEEDFPVAVKTEELTETVDVFMKAWRPGVQICLVQMKRVIEAQAAQAKAAQQEPGRKRALAGVQK